MGLRISHDIAQQDMQDSALPTMAEIARILCCRRTREGPPLPKPTPLPWSKVRIAHTREETVTDVYNKDITISEVAIVSQARSNGPRDC